MWWVVIALVRLFVLISLQQQRLSFRVLRSRLLTLVDCRITKPRTSRRRARHPPRTPHQTRADADKAIRAMNGLALHEYELRIGWGKSVPLPAQPLYDGKVGSSWSSRSVKFAVVSK